MTIQNPPQPWRAVENPLVATLLDPRWRAFAPPAWLERWRVERVAVEGGEVEIVEAGEGPPLVLLPPLPGWKEAYLALLPILARRFRVLTFDLRSRFTGRARWEALVADAERIVATRFGGESVAVFGHSLGGALALRWAIDRPTRIRALVLSSAFRRVFTPRGAGIARWLEQPVALAAMRWLPARASAGAARRLAAGCRWVFDPHCDPHVIDLVRHGVRTVPLALVSRRVGLALEVDPGERLSHIACPVLILHGERDTEFARASAAELAATLPQAQRAVIAEAGHLHPLSRPEELGRVVTDWITGLDTDATARHAFVSIRSRNDESH